MRAAALLAILLAGAADFPAPVPGLVLELPRDHGSHPAFRTEWWYFTGNLESDDGRRFGFKLTFFRNRTATDAALDAALARRPAPLLLRQIHAVNLAISDIGAGRLHSSERIGREGFAQAWAREETFDVANHDVRGRLDDSGTFHLSAAAGGSSPGLELTLTPQKPCVLHGREGVHQKAADAGETSHYLSCTRLATRGRLRLGGRDIAVRGVGWMDHEWGSSGLALVERGWDWFGIALESGEELMVYQLRGPDGRVDPVHFGSLVHADGRVEELGPLDSEIVATGSWKSPRSGATYPMGWQLRFPRHAGELVVTPALVDQEMVMTRSTGVTYWEGAVVVDGRFRDRPARGRGYAELVGYARRDSPVPPGRP